MQIVGHFLKVRHCLADKVFYRKISIPILPQKIRSHKKRNWADIHSVSRIATSTERENEDLRIQHSVLISAILNITIRRFTEVVHFKLWKLRA